MPDEPRELSQEEKAQAALWAIFGGADLTEEAMKLANDYTDSKVEGFKRLFRAKGDA
jgi:hypothetical protein